MTNSLKPMLSNAAGDNNGTMNQIDLCIEVLSNEHARTVLKSGHEKFGMEFIVFVLGTAAAYIQKDKLLEAFQDAYCFAASTEEEAHRQLLEFKGWNLAVEELGAETEGMPFGDLLSWNLVAVRERFELEYEFVYVDGQIYVFDHFAIERWLDS